MLLAVLAPEPGRNERAGHLLVNATASCGRVSYVVRGRLLLAIAESGPLYRDGAWAGKMFRQRRQKPALNYAIGYVRLAACECGVEQSGSSSGS